MIKMKIPRFSIIILTILLLSQIPLSYIAFSEAKSTSQSVSQGKWWEVGEIEGEAIVPGYIPYSQLLPALHEIEKTSNRIQIEVVGKSCWGYDILQVIVSDPSTLGRLGAYKSLANDIVNDPEKVLEKLDKGILDYKGIVQLAPSIHGGEMGGVDAALQLINELAFDDSEEVRKILDNLIVIINPCVNPDGRIANRRQNGNGYDVNRDYITATQPEMRVLITTQKEWNPLIDVRAHGYRSATTLLIEPATMPHCPNFPYDLIEKWLYPMSLVQEEALFDIGITRVDIPYRDYWAEGGWDDYPPTMAVPYVFYHGSIGQCNEGPRGDVLEPIGVPDDILAHYTSEKAALLFAADHHMELLRNQLEMFIRWEQGYGWRWTGPAWDLPDANTYEPQGSLYKFPYAYVIPMDDELQLDTIHAAKLVDHVLFHGCKVMKASQPFTTESGIFPAGTYVVLMNQAKSGLANTLLWDGEDLSYDPGVPMYDDAAWNLPELWGVTVHSIDEEFDAKLQPVNKVSYPAGEILGFPAEYAYALKDNTNNAVNMVNKLLEYGVFVGRTDAPFTYDKVEFGVGTFIIPANQDKLVSTLNNLVKDLHLKLYGLNEDIGVSYYEISSQKIAILDSSGVGSYERDYMVFMLNDFGFESDLVNVEQIELGMLANYDVLYVPDGTASRIWNGLGAVAQGKLMEFIEDGGRFIGAGQGSMLVNYANFLDAEAVLSTVPAGRPNGVVRVNYDPLDPVTAYYPEDGYAFVYYPVLFYDLGPDVKVAASLASEEMFVAGYWPGNEDAEGDSIIIHGAYGNGEVILIGTSCNRRMLAIGMFRLLTNSIYP